MKLLTLGVALILVSCTTTTTTKPDGTVMVLRQSDPKTVRIIAGAMSQAAADAIATELRRQIEEQR